MAKIKLIKFWRGLESSRASVTPEEGEPLYATDTKELYIGDGSTPGGNPVGSIRTTGDPAEDEIAAFADAEGKTLKGITKASIITGLATTTEMNNGLASKLDVSTKASTAITADNALQLGQKDADQYLSVDDLTDSYTEGSDKVVKASGVKGLHDYLKGLYNTLSNTVGTIQTALNTAETTIEDNKTKLASLPDKITQSNLPPTGGSDGDVWIQY